VERAVAANIDAMHMMCSDQDASDNAFALTCAVTGINIADLRALPVSFPDKRRQMELIEKMDGLSRESRRLEANYVEKLSQINKLKQAILGAAFSGKLTALPTRAINEAAE
jgi:translation elongation factor EF-G